MAENMKAENVVLATYGSYNERRYSRPWLAIIKSGRYDFDAGRAAGYCTEASAGDGGDIIIRKPATGVVYAHGQKDHRGKGTRIRFAKWDGEKFVECDKAGR